MPHSKFVCLLGILLVACSLIPWTSGQLVKFGVCPAVAAVVPSPVPNPLNFLVPIPPATGIWFEQLRFSTQYEKMMKCVKWTLLETAVLAGPIPETLTATISGTLKVIETPRVINGILRTLDPAFLRWTADFPKPAYFGRLTPSHFPRDLIVIGLENLAVPTWVVFYSCKTFGPFRIQSVFILTKARFPTQLQLDQAIQSVANAGLPTFHLEAVEQTVCAA